MNKRQKRRIRLSVLVGFATVLLPLLGAMGCHKDDPPTNDPSYYAGKDFKQGESTGKKVKGDN